MIDWNALGKKIQDRPPKTTPQKPQNCIEGCEKDIFGAFGAGKGGTSRKIFPSGDANRLLAELDLSQVRERYYTGNTDSPAHSSTADKKRPSSQGQEAPAHRTASISLPADNRPPGELPPHGGPQVDRLKDLLLPFQPWPVTLALDAAGHIQVKASRLLLSRVQAYCEQHGPELQTFLKSCPGHAWRSGEAIRRSGKHEGQGTD